MIVPPLKRSHKVQILGLGAVFTFVFMLALLSSILNANSVQNRRNDSVKQNPDLNVTTLRLQASLTKVDLGASQFTFRVDVLTPDILTFARQSIQLMIFGRMVLVNVGFPIPSQEFTVMSAADTNTYPFDVATGNATITAFTTTPRTTIPVGIVVQGSVQGWITEFTPPEIVTNSDGSLVTAFSITSKRGITTKGFAIFISICMWILSLTAFTLASTLWFRGRKVEPATIGVIGTLLFSLPAIRATQPGIPGIGCTLDWAGFLWCMFMVMVSMFSLMWNYVLKYSLEKELRNEKVHELVGLYGP